MDLDPTNGFFKLNFLLNNPPAPPETFGNLLLLYCKFQVCFRFVIFLCIYLSNFISYLSIDICDIQFYDTAADIMADHEQLRDTALSQVHLFIIEQQ